MDYNIPAADDIKRKKEEAKEARKEWRKIGYEDREASFKDRWNKTSHKLKRLSRDVSIQFHFRRHDGDIEHYVRELSDQLRDKGYSVTTDQDFWGRDYLLIKLATKD